MEDFNEFRSAKLRVATYEILELKEVVLTDASSRSPRLDEDDLTPGGDYRRGLSLLHEIPCTSLAAEISVLFFPPKSQNTAFPLNHREAEQRTSDQSCRPHISP